MLVGCCSPSRETGTVPPLLPSPHGILDSARALAQEVLSVSDDAWCSTSEELFLVCKVSQGFCRLTDSQNRHSSSYT